MAKRIFINYRRGDTIATAGRLRDRLAREFGRNNVFMDIDKRVIHVHDELLKARCAACEVASPWREDLGLRDRCPACGGMGVLRPHVVWFGEMPLEMDEIYAALRKADLFVAIGTSGSVYPAAGFVSEARVLDIRTCEINLEPSDNANQFDERRYGPASEAVPAWVDEFLAST
jgi:NAD-dependent deacetylase